MTTLTNAWPENVAFIEDVPVSSTYRGAKTVGRKNALLVSVAGLEGGRYALFYADYLRACRDLPLAFLISHQANPHIFMRIDDQFVDYKLLLQLHEPPQLRARPYQLARKFKIEASVHLTPAETQRLRTYLDNILANRLQVLGEPPYQDVSDPESLDVTVKSHQTKGTLGDNRLLHATERHNCLTWITSAPIGDMNASLAELLGFTAPDYEAEAHSYTVAFARYLLARANDKRTNLLVVQSCESLAAMRQHIEDPDYFDTAVLCPPDPS